MRMYKLMQSLYILGDIGYYSNPLNSIINQFKYDAMLDNSKIILLGDNFYPDGIQTKYDNQWKKFDLAFKDIPYQNIYTVMGNHDYHGNPLLQIQSKYFSNNELYYKESFKNIDLYFLDTILLYKGHCYIKEEKINEIFNKPHQELKNEQLIWFENNLKISQSQNKRIVVFGHYPVLSNGYYTNELKPMYKSLMPLFEKYKVDAYISGHEHNIQYINKQINEDYSFNQFIVGSSSEYRTNEFKNEKHNDMFDNNDYYYLKLNSIDNMITIEFKDRNGNTKYCYMI